MQMQEGKIQITICGGGNGSHATTGYVGSKKNFKVNVFTRHPSEWKKQIKVITAGSSWAHMGDITGKVRKCSNNPSDLSKCTKIWLISGPAHIHLILLQQIDPLVEAGAYIGTLYAQGGFDWMCNYVFGERLKKDGITIFGLLNIPWICKIVTYGEAVRIIGPKKALYCASYPHEEANKISLLLENMFDIPTFTVPNFLTLTLTPSNQIIHPARVYGVFKNWDGKKVFKQEEIPLFYEDMDDFSASMLELLDREIQLIKRTIQLKYPNINLSFVLPLKERIIKQYGDQVGDPTSLQSVFRTNQGYATVKIPVKEMQGGVIPNIDGRIFWEDIPYGLCTLKDLGKLLGLQMPAVDKMIEWHQQYMGKKFLINGQLNQALINETSTPTRYGYSNFEQIARINSTNPKL